MPISNIGRIEGVLQVVAPITVEVLMIQFGINVEVYEPVHDKYSELYGSYSGDTEEVYSRMQELLFTGVHAFGNISPVDMPLFEEGYAYVKKADTLTIGSRIRLLREDAKDLWFMVEEEEAIGSTLDIIKRYKLSAIEY